MYGTGMLWDDCVLSLHPSLPHSFPPPLPPSSPPLPLPHYSFPPSPPSLPLIPSLQPSGALPTLPGIPPIDDPTHHHHDNPSRYSIHVQYVLNSPVCHVEMFALLCIELSLLSYLGSQGLNPTQGSRTAFGFNWVTLLYLSQDLMYNTCTCTCTCKLYRYNVLYMCTCMYT